MHIGIGWILAAICAFVAVYVWSYFRFPSSVSIIQTDLAGFSFDMLREKQPVVLDDKLNSLDELRALWFPSNFTAAFRLQGSAHDWHLNHFKHALLHAEQEGDVYLSPAGAPIGQDGLPDPQHKLVAVHMLPGQVLILPFRWRYLIMEPLKVSALGIHDYVTYVLP